MDLVSLIILGICFLFMILERAFEKGLEYKKYTYDKEYELRLAEIEAEANGDLNFKK